MALCAHGARSATSTWEQHSYLDNHRERKTFIVKTSRQDTVDLVQSVIVCPSSCSTVQPAIHVLPWSPLVDDKHSCHQHQQKWNAQASNNGGQYSHRDLVLRRRTVAQCAGPGERRWSRVSCMLQGAGAQTGGSPGEVARAQGAVVPRGANHHVHQSNVAWAGQMAKQGRGQPLRQRVIERDSTGVSHVDLL